MLIQMTETKRIYDGEVIRLLKSGEQYDLGDFDARCLISDGRAKCIDPQYQQAEA